MPSGSPSNDHRPPRRVFLGWNQPALPAVADHLVERFDRDMGTAWVVVPTARAGRQLENRLLERRPVYVPPRIVTPGAFLDAWTSQALPPDTPTIASGLESGLAWVSVLRAFAGLTESIANQLEAGQSRLAALVPSPPQPDDWPGWWSLAQRVLRMREQLASGRASMADAAEATTGSRTRWAVLAALDTAYEATLDSWNRIDRETARRQALQAQAQTLWSPPVILAALADQTPLQQSVFRRCADLTTLVFADESHAERFDGLGGLLTQPWIETYAEVPIETLQIVDRSAEETDAVAHAVADAAEAWSAQHDEPLDESRVTIALADETRGQPVVRGVRAAGGSARTAAGRPLADSAPATMLRGLARLIETGRFDALAEVARHPDIESYVRNKLAGQTISDIPWPTLLDTWVTRTLRSDLLAEWLEASSESTHGEVIPTLNRGESIAQFYRLVWGLMPTGDRELRRLSDWSPALRQALTHVYGHRSLNAESPADAETIQALELLAVCIDQQAELHGPDDANPQVSAAAAIHWTLARLAGQRSADPPTAGQIEAMGLLDAALDDAPVLVVASANDGFLPGTVTDPGDGLLPDSLRARLGVPSNADRLARDAYLLEAMRRPRSFFKMIAARRGDDDEPLKPSRLWVRADRSESTAKRLLCFYGRPAPGETSTPSESTNRDWLRPGSVNRFVIPRPDPEAPLPEKLAVTALRDYLACPYRFYLNHVLQLRPLSDAARELDAPAFGSLIHDALADFGKAPADLRSASDPEIIADALTTSLHRRAARALGTEPRPAVRVQLAFAQERLEAFAHLQAGWNREGWQIADVEHPASAEFHVAEGHLTLEGRIDRIDTHPEFGLRVIDFKTGDTATKPMPQHAQIQDGRRTWLDLQLPMYRDLIHRDPAWSSLQHEHIEVGFALLPRKAEETAWAPLEAEAEFWEDASRQRDSVLAGILRRDFRPSLDAPRYRDAFTGLCADDWPGRRDDIEHWLDPTTTSGAPSA